MFTESYIVVFCILFITCVSIVIVWQSLYRAAVSALNLVVLPIIMLFEVLYMYYYLSK